jgi:hypothetical protein
MIGLLCVAGVATAQEGQTEVDSSFGPKSVVSEKLCAMHQCDYGYRVNPEEAHKESADFSLCCIPTCAAHKCESPGKELKLSSVLTSIPRFEKPEPEDLCCQEKWVDVTEVFAGQETVEKGDDTWKCCCSGEKCKLKALPKEKSMWDKMLQADGCLKLAGPGHHSFFKLEAPKNKCIVKEKEAFESIKWMKWETRQANDGRWYAFSGENSFESHYGDVKAAVMWNSAIEYSR